MLRAPRASFLLGNVRRSPASRAVPSVCARRFATQPVPLPKSPSPDGVYRRPGVPMPRGPMSEENELVWPDGQAPEPGLDRFTHTYMRKPLLAVATLVTALFVVVRGGSWLVSVYDPASRQPTAPQTFPFDGLSVERGGPLPPSHTAA